MVVLAAFESRREPYFPLVFCKFLYGFFRFACWGGLILVGLIFGVAARRLRTREDPETDTDQWQR